MKKTLLSALLLAASLPLAQAQIALTNWSITTDTLSFDLSGTSQVGVSASWPDRIWLAAPGNHAWINGDDNPDYTITGTIDGVDITSQSQTAYSFTGNATTNVGLYFTAGDDMDPVAYDFSDNTGNEVNLHVVLNFPGKYNPGSIDPATLNLYWGGDPFTAGPNSAMNLGLTYATAPVPEPATYAALAGLCALGLAAWRRRRTA